MDNKANGHADPLLGAAIAGEIPTAAVNPNVVQMFSDMLNRARRGEINSAMIIAVNGASLGTFDVMVMENMAHAVMILGSMQVTASKITQAVRDSQRPLGPVSKIIRPVAPGGVSPTG